MKLHPCGYTIRNITYRPNPVISSHVVFPTLCIRYNTNRALAIPQLCAGCTRLEAVQTKYKKDEAHLREHHTNSDVVDFRRFSTKSQYTLRSSVSHAPRTQSQPGIDKERMPHCFLYCIPMSIHLLRLRSSILYA